ncbi:MAG: ASPIC/UnbV domain-containing protein [Verrucomicrobiales bacterium]
MSQSPQTTEASPDQAERYRRGWKALSELIGQGRSFSGHEKDTCFLNTQDGKFADASACSGLGYDDDGRAVATCDWDCDGKTDFWVSYRTAPRVRLLRNASTATGNWLTLQLKGTTCNRDAIGARVVITLPGGQMRTRSLRAGEGFLAQSSKWLPFGLGSVENVERVTIHWPGGKAEDITGVVAGKHQRIVQGTGKAEVIPPPAKSALAVSDYPKPPEEETMRTWLVGRISLLQNSAIPAAGQPVLVNLWSKTCAPCITEMAEWTKHAKVIKAAGLEILAVNMDGLTEGGKFAAPPKGFPFLAANASTVLVESMELLHRVTVELQTPLPAPSSFLLDKSGRVAAIYKGPVPVTLLLADAALLDKPAEAQRDAAVPFAGRWASQPFPPQPLRYAEAFASIGQPAWRTAYLAQYDRQFPSPDVQSHLGQLHLADGRLNEAIATFAGLFTSAPDNPGFHRDAGIALLQRNAGEPARKHLIAAQTAFANDASFQFNLGLAEASTGRGDDAITRFRTVIKLDATDAIAHFQLANLLHVTRRGKEALPHYREALRLRPDLLPAANNLAWLLATDLDATVRHGAESLKIAQAIVNADRGQNPATLSTLAAAFAETGDFARATAAMQAALKLTTDAAQVQQFKATLKRLQAGQPIRAEK